MVVTRSPDAGENNRPFSGPPTSVTGDIAGTSGRDYVLAEQPEKVERANGAVSSPSTSADDTTISNCNDISSDGGSTVRELNRQLMSSDEDDGNGNDGSVSEQVGEDFHLQRNKRSRRRSECSKSDSSQVNTTKRKRVDNNFDLYLKGIDFNIAKEASRQPIEFNRKLHSLVGQVRNVRLINNCVRITCVTEKQKVMMLKLTDWFGKVVNVSEPWGKVPHVTERPTTLMRRGIIFGVSEELTEFEVASEIKAEAVRRLVKWDGSGDRVKTTTMVVSFRESVPDHVYIGCLRYKVRPYVPQPMRCVKCQGYGHTATHCKRQTRCVRCGKGHTIEHCPVKDDLTKAVCVNCNGQHSAAFRGCSRYQEVSKALKVSVESKVSYRDALMKVRSSAGDVSQRVGEAAEIGRPQQTSTPLPAAAPTTSRPAASSRRSPASRQLFQTTPTQSARPAESVDESRATAAKATSDDMQRQSDSRLTGFLKQITHHLLYTLAILDRANPNKEFAFLWNNLNAVASNAFGQHGLKPCLSPNCKKPKA